ncbi:hypothetical protein D3870_12555 [Noviherbaspirillum cavernae]|uniref:Uncharacterized protein n=1 Tax=Noviherbaspirillum cavernae TaxID=2320862 RepID=A0A418X2S4_9BURK|nr:hypothetical protein [Noviherbaspirillum cavernae]RJG06725.1 hypothetical protein D3870_12555 [Noviherbaspirillum cavernae]
MGDVMLALFQRLAVNAEMYPDTALKNACTEGIAQSAMRSHDTSLACLVEPTIQEIAVRLGMRRRVYFPHASHRDIFPYGVYRMKRIPE